MNKKEIMQDKLSKLIQNRSRNAMEAFARINEEGRLLNDVMLSTRNLTFRANGRLLVGFDHEEFYLHANALRQVSERFGVPNKYLQDLAARTDWGRRLAETILNEHTMNTERERLLIRTVGTEVRAILSDRYRRLDSIKIYQAFLKGASAFGGTVVDAHCDATKGYIEVIRPEVISAETPNNGTEYFAIGARIRNSDFGDGAMEIGTFLLKVVCNNGMVGKSVMREIHLGKQLPDNIKLSEETYRLDTERTASVVTDAVHSLFSPEAEEQIIRRIQGASAEAIEVKDEIQRLPKLGFLKSEIDLVERLLLNRNEEDGIQGRASLWQFAQALGAAARELNPTRRREIEEVAGDYINLEVKALKSPELILN